MALTDSFNCMQGFEKMMVRYNRLLLMDEVTYEYARASKQN
ncbi:MAG: hypothetical protein US69_C0002G0092 [candidate division TM6 bacterium GW2011_GWF2_38_10]|nr:MAG: hypothetical protein US69_C0002G0092 [candidate division TM6 bacterium GW2011_GWF2_38_10]